MRVECDRFDRWASLYRDFRLPGRARTAVERHLGYCKVCAARYEAYTASLDAARTEPTASSLIPADVTHEIPARPTSEIAPLWRGRVGGLAVWLLGVGMLLALLAAAFVLGFRAGTRSSRPDPTPVVERSAPRLVSLR